MSPTRHALVGAWLGFFVDMFDVYLPITALAPAAIYFEATDASASTGAILSIHIFAAALLGRPIGAVIFGQLADKIGRRRVTLISVTGFGVSTLTIAALPGYEQWGLVAVIMLIALRLVDGIFLGGEYTGASVLALECSPRPKRGLYGAIIMTGYPLAYCATALITFATLKIVPAAGLDSPYVQWGWRVPFVVGGLMAFVFVVWYARNVRESPSWAQAAKSASPLRDLFRGNNLRLFLQVFTLMTGSWLAANVLAAVLPRLLAEQAGLDSSAVTIVQVISYAVLALVYPAAGALSQHIGRRRYFFVTATTTALPGAALLGWLASGTVTSLPSVILLVTAVNILAFSTAAVTTTYLNERFTVDVRSTGFGIGFSAAIVIPSFYAFYQAGLATLMPAEYTALVLLALGGVLIATGAYVGSDTRDVDMADTGRHARTGAP